MGESIEFTTWPNHPNLFYKVNSNAFSFEVKAPGNASIRLAKKPGGHCDLQIALGHNRNSWIKVFEPNGDKKTVPTPDILSSEEYRRFWIKWYGEYVCVGREGQIKPIIICNRQVPNLKFVTFSVIENDRNPVHWRFDVPPFLEQPILKPIVDGDLHWVQVDSENRFPDDALIGGFEKENLYIIRAPHRGSITPGKFVSSEGVGYVSWGGDAHEKDSFEILCGFDCTWVPTSYDKIPVGAVVGGQAEGVQQEKLYIGRAKYMGYLITGKVQPSHKVCYVPYEGKEVAQETYEILVHPNNTMHTAHKLLVPPVPHVEQIAQNSDEDSEYSYYEEDEEQWA